ncbi:arylamine N-acetyltransferase, partial [Kibdelosporangium lantanae]
AGATVDNVRVYLAGRDPAGLTAYAQAVSDPRDPNFRHFLTPEEVSRRFGASRDQTFGVVNWLESAGLTVTNVDQHYVSARGTVTQGVWTYRLVREDSQWVFQCEGRDGWETMYRFAVEHTYPADYAMANHYTATWSGSPFRQRLIAQQATPTVRLRLSGNVRTVADPDGVKDEQTLTREEVLASLADDFGIELNDEETAGLPIG